MTIYDAKRKLCWFLLFSFFAVARLAAVVPGAQALVPAGHWIYDDLDFLCMETGTVSFAVSAPRTVGEIKLYLEKIDTGLLGVAGRETYGRVKDFLEKTYPGFESGLLNAGLAVDFALEGYFKTNKDIAWNYPYQKRQPLVDIPFGFSLGDYLTVASSVTVAQNVEALIAHDNYVNFPFPLSKFDVNFPRSAYGSFGVMLSDDTGMNFRIARGAQSVGNTFSGSVVLSDYCSNESYAEFAVFSPKFRYALNVTELNPPRKDNMDPAYMYLHRLEFRFFEKLTFTLLEGVLVNAPLELRFLNPLMVWHGYASWNDYHGEGNNPEKNIVKKEASLLGVNLDFVPCKGVRLYFLYAMNQFQTAYERKHWPDSAIPNAMAFQGGLQLAFPVGDGYVHGALEGVYTTPYMYLMEGADWSYMRDYDENIGMNNVREWVGTPFGPDSICAVVSAGYKVPGKWDAVLSYVFSVQGELSNPAVVDGDYWPTSVEQASVKTPTGTPQFTHRILLSGTWHITDKIRLETRPSYVLRFNAENKEDIFRQGFEFTASCAFSLF